MLSFKVRSLLSTMALFNPNHFFLYTKVIDMKTMTFSNHIIGSVDSISRDERDAPLTQYITNVGITRASYTVTHFKFHRRVLGLISNRMSV